MRSSIAALGILAASLAACGAPPRELAQSSLPNAIDEAIAPPKSPPGATLPATTRTGGTIARSPKADALYIADEDHKVLRRLSLPLDAEKPPVVLAMPGAPAEVLALDGLVLVTVRDPGLLLVLEDRGEEGLVETSRIALPADAWGLALSADERTAIVTSAWTAKTSGIDLETGTVSWTVEVPREPRGVVITADGKTAYVSHLVGSAITKLDLDVDGATPSVRSIELPAAPLRAPYGTSLHASLGYSLVLSEDGSRLYAPRHALGAMGVRAWFGAPTVDVMLTANDTPLAPPRRTEPARARVEDFMLDGTAATLGTVPAAPMATFSQPRAATLRSKTGTLLVVGEGSDSLVELDAHSIDPGLMPIRTHFLGDRRDPKWGTARFCGAPSGVVLSADEGTAYVYCRSTDDLAIVTFAAGEKAPYSVAGMKLDEAPGSKEAAIGRRLFFGGNDDRTSGGIGCASCHPDGRDDGHTWHEVMGPMTGGLILVGNEHDLMNVDGAPAGYARQTPILAGHVAASGPYGWHGQSKDLAARAAEGFTLHRWDGGFVDAPTAAILSKPIAAYLREGLTPPPREDRALTATEARGKSLFESDNTGCASCHVPSTDYTDHLSYVLGKSALPRGFEDDPNDAFKTPSLRSLAGTAPYFHDGSAPTLEAVISENHDRMGHTSQLSAPDRAALVAFLRTL